MSDDKPRELDVEELFAELGISRLREGGLRVPSRWTHDWFAGLAGTLVVGFLGHMFGAWWYFEYQGFGPARQLPPLIVTWALMFIGLVVTVGVTGRTTIDFLREGLVLGTLWPLGLRTGRRVDWRDVEKISLVDWGAAGKHPGFTVCLASGKSVSVEWFAVPVGVAKVLPLIAEEAGLAPEVCEMLLDACREFIGLRGRDDGAVLSLEPPNLDGVSLKTNALEELEFEFSEATPMVRAKVRVTLEGLYYESAGPIQTLHFDVPVKELSMHQIRAHPGNQFKEHLAVVWDENSVSFESLTLEQNGWIQARLEAIWDKKALDEPSGYVTRRDQYN
jgi:hypothetical protein